MHEITTTYSNTVLEKTVNKLTYEKIIKPLQIYIGNPEEHKIYAFCWPGGMSNAIRKISSEILYEEVLLLRKKYPNAEFRFFGYIYGGSIILEAG